MAFDGAFLYGIGREIETRALGARVDKVFMPSREEIILALRSAGGACRLMLSARASCPRVHFTSLSVENPKQPLMLCMLLRKLLTGAKLVGVRQNGLDRVLFLDFDATDEMGDRVTLTLAAEIMSRHSNIILISGEGKIIDAVKRVDMEMSSARQVLPGMAYRLPPPQDKLNPNITSTAEILSRLNQKSGQPLSKGLMSVVEGISPVVARELEFLTFRGGKNADLDDESASRLAFYLDRLFLRLRQGDNQPTMVTDGGGNPIDFSFDAITQYGTGAVTKRFDSLSELLDQFFGEKDARERIHQRFSDLLRLLVNISDRATRKIAHLKEELQECSGRDHLRVWGELINANLYRLKKGMSEAKVENFYLPDCLQVAIPLDLSLNPGQNAQKYFKEYKKHCTAENILKEQIQKAEEEVAYIDSVVDALSRARSESDIAEVRQELAAQGYVRLDKSAKDKKKQEKSSFRKYLSSDGFAIWVGKNNIQNDRLTLREARNNDFWFHVKNGPGSHTVVLTEGKTNLPDRLYTEAAMIAAYHSKARESAQVAVDYTQIRNIKKPVGAKPGFVTYDNYFTAYVTPNRELVESMEK